MSLKRIAKRVNAIGTQYDLVVQGRKVKTPWGDADFEYPITKGVAWYSTPSHGGLKVSGGAARRYLSPQARAVGEKRNPRAGHYLRL